MGDSREIHYERVTNGSIRFDSGYGSFRTRYAIRLNHGLIACNGPSKIALCGSIACLIDTVIFLSIGTRDSLFVYMRSSRPGTHARKGQDTRDVL